MSCKSKLKNYESMICNICESTLQKASTCRLDEEFQRKFEEERLVKDFISLYVFEEGSVIQNLIHSLKYNENYHIGFYLGKSIYTTYKESLSKFNADFIIPVPLHHLKKAERGYNQAAEIAKGLSKPLDIPINNRILKRSAYTKSQTKFSLIERKDNIKGAFQIRSKNKVKNKTIILVDDVITTGATISECARILIDNSAKAVFAVSAAIAH